MFDVLFSYKQKTEELLYNLTIEHDWLFIVSVKRLAINRSDINNLLNVTVFTVLTLWRNRVQRG